MSNPRLEASKNSGKSVVGGDVEVTYVLLTSIEVRGGWYAHTDELDSHEKQRHVRGTRRKELDIRNRDGRDDYSDVPFSVGSRDVGGLKGARG